MLFKKEDICGSEYVNRVAPNILEALYNSVPRRIADLIKEKRGATEYRAIMMKDAVEFSLECT